MDEQKRDAGGFEDVMRGRAALEAAVARSSADDRDGWLRGVQEAAHELFLTIEQHEGLTETEGGILSNATAHEPRLMYARQRRELEHDDMLHRLREIEVEAERQIAAQDYNIELVRLQARVLLEILLLHVVRTNDLLFEAYVRVEGGEG